MPWLGCLISYFESFSLRIKESWFLETISYNWDFLLGILLFMIFFINGEFSLDLSSWSLSVLIYWFALIKLKLLLFVTFGTDLWLAKQPSLTAFSWAKLEVEKIEGIGKFIVETVWSGGEPMAICCCFIYNYWSLILSISYYCFLLSILSWVFSTFWTTLSFLFSISFCKSRFKFN